MAKNTYSKEFKIRIAKLYKDGTQPKDLMKKYNLPRSTLHDMIRKYKDYEEPQEEPAPEALPDPSPNQEETILALVCIKETFTGFDANQNLHYLYFTATVRSVLQLKYFDLVKKTIPIRLYERSETMLRRYTYMYASGNRVFVTVTKSPADNYYCLMEGEFCDTL